MFSDDGLFDLTVLPPPGEAKPDGRIFWDLAGRRGLFNAAALRKMPPSASAVWYAMNHSPLNSVMAG